MEKVLTGVFAMVVLLGLPAGAVVAAEQGSGSAGKPSGDLSALEQLLSTPAADDRDMTPIPVRDVAADCAESGESCAENPECCGEDYVDPLSICD